jgi:hypothetical protein
MVTVPPIVTALARSWVLVRDASVKVTAWDAGKLRIETLPVTAPKVVACDAGKFEIETAENVTLCDTGKLSTETLPVTAPKVVDWDAGKLEIETTLPLTALCISVMACVPRLTTVWAVIC